MKRIISLIVAVLMTVGLMAACTGTDEPTAQTQSPATNPPADSTQTPADDSAEPDPTDAAPVENVNQAARDLADKYGLPYTPMSEMDPIEFTYFHRDSNEPPAANEVLDTIEAITNVKFNYEFLVGDLETKMGVMIASGDMNDVVFVGGEADRFIDAGSFLPLEDLIEENAPNLRAHFDPWWELMKRSDGHIYIAEIFGTPTGEQIVTNHNGSAFWMQKDVLDHFGRFPATIEEYFDFIREYKELYPTIDGVPTIGFEILTEGWLSFCLKNSSMFLAGLPNWGDLGFDEETRQAYNRIINDDAKKWFKLLNDEFQKGTIPAESLTRTYDQYIAQLSTGNVLGMHDQGWNFGNATNALIAENKDNRTYLPIALVFDGVAEHQYLDYPAFVGNNGIGLSKTNKDPVRFVQFMDYIIQEPVQRFLDWGIEGVHWSFNSEGRMIRPEEQRVLQSDNEWRENNLGIMLKNALPKLQGTFTDGNDTAPGNQPEEYYASLRPYDKTLFEKLGVLTQAAALGEPKEHPAGYPIWSMTWEDAPDAADTQTEWTDVQARYLPRLVITEADNFETLWAEFVNAMSEVNMEPWFDAAERKYQERMDIMGQ